MCSYMRSPSSRTKPCRAKMPTLMNSGYRRRLHSHWHSKEATWPHNSGFSRQSCTSSAIRPAAFFLPPARSQEVSPSNRVKACRSSTCCWMKGNKEFWFKRIRIFLPWVFCSGEPMCRLLFQSPKAACTPSIGFGCRIVFCIGCRNGIGDDRHIFQRH